MFLPSMLRMKNLRLLNRVMKMIFKKMRRNLKKKKKNMKKKVNLKMTMPSLKETPRTTRSNPTNSENDEPLLVWSGIYHYILLLLPSFPNVGKSSLINVLIGVCPQFHGTRVAVGPTPGKTKHFQTILLSDELMLCDCPGLVFPVFMNTKADLIFNGILPVSNLRDHICILYFFVSISPSSYEAGLPANSS